MASIQLDNNFDTNYGSSDGSSNAAKINTDLSKLLDTIKDLVKDGIDSDQQISRLLNDPAKLEELLGKGGLEESISKVVEDIGDLSDKDKHEFLKSILTQVKNDSDTLRKQFKDNSRSATTDAKTLESLIGNAVKKHNKASGYGEKSTSIKNEIKASFDAASPEFKNTINNLIEIDAKGEVKATGSEIDLAMQAKTIHTAAEKELKRISKELAEAEGKKEAALRSGDKVAAEQYDKIVKALESAEKGITDSVKKMGEKAGSTMSREDRATNNKIVRGADDKAVENARNKTLTGFDKVGQATSRWAGTLDQASAGMDHFGKLMASAGGETKGISMASGYVSDFGNVLSRIGPGMFTLAGGIALLGAAIGVATRAVGAYHDQLNVSREMGDNAGGLVKDLQNMHIKSLLDPAQLKSLSDQVSQGFSVSLTRNQQEMQNVAIKQRLSERVMGKEYAADQMAALNSLKESLAGNSPTEMMDTLANNTAALAKTMGISNKMALDHLKALNQNTKVLTDGLNKDIAAKIQKSFAQVEAGLVAAGVSKEEAQALTKESADTLADPEKIRNEIKIMSKLLSENGEAAKDIRAGAAAAGMTEEQAIQLMKEASMRGTQNMTSDEQAKLAQITASSKIAQSTKMEELSKRIENNDEGAKNERMVYGQMGLKANSSLANARDSLKAQGKDFRTEMDRGKESFKINDAGASATQDLNAILLKMGATNQTEKNEKLNQLIAAQSGEQQAKFAAEMERIAKEQGTTVEAIKNDKSNPEKFQQLQNDAYKNANAEAIKAVGKGEDISKLGSGIKDSSGKAITGADVLATKKDKDFTEKSSKLSDTKVEAAKDSAEQLALKASYALQNAITDLNPWIIALIGAIGLLTAAILASNAIATGGKMFGKLFDFFKTPSATPGGPGVVSKVGGAVWDGAKAASSSIGSGLKTVGTGALNVVKAAPSTLGRAVSAVGSAGSSLGSAVSTGASAAKGGLGSMVSTGMQAATKSLGSFVEVAKTGMSTLGQSAMTAAKGGLTSLGSAVTSAGSGLIGGLGKAASGFLKFAGPVGVLVTAGAAIYGAVDGWGKASEYFGKETVSFSEKMSSAIGGALETLSFGL